jgi:hypothetical protein
MAKDTGLGANFYIDGTDVSGDTNALSKISKSLTALDFTGIDKFAFEKIAGKLDGGIDWEAFYNPTNAHPLLSTLPRTDRIISYVHKASVLGTPVANIAAKQMSYDLKRPDDGKVTFSVESAANAYWLDWSRSLTTGKQTLVAAGNTTGVDFQIQGAPASFGLQAYIHVFSFTGTSATITLQGSSDDAAGDPYANITGGGFTVVSSAPQAQRIATARDLAVERYIRLNVTGVFTNLVIAASVTVNTTEMTI